MLVVDAKFIAPIDIPGANAVVRRAGEENLAERIRC